VDLTGDAQQWIIQLERPDGNLTLDEARSVLEPLGVTLDPTYNPVPVNPRLGRFAVKGLASAETRSRAERLAGIRFFRDSKISPVHR
jgi:hypothetical protein